MSRALSGRSPRPTRGPAWTSAGSYRRSRSSENAFVSGGDGGAWLGVQSRRRNLFRAGFDASWEVDVFGGVRRRVEAADANVEPSSKSGATRWSPCWVIVARNYIELRGFQRRLAVARSNLQAQQETLDLTKVRFRGRTLQRFRGGAGRRPGEHDRGADSHSRKRAEGKRSSSRRAARPTTRRAMGGTQQRSRRFRHCRRRRMSVCLPSSSGGGRISGAPSGKSPLRPRRSAPQRLICIRDFH